MFYKIIIASGWMRSIKAKSLYRLPHLFVSRPRPRSNFLFRPAPLGRLFAGYFISQIRYLIRIRHDKNCFFTQLTRGFTVINCCIKSFWRLFDCHRGERTELFSCDYNSLVRAVKPPSAVTRDYTILIMYPPVVIPPKVFTVLIFPGA